VYHKLNKLTNDLLCMTFLQSCYFPNTQMANPARHNGTGNTTFHLISCLSTMLMGKEMNVVLII